MSSVLRFKGVVDEEDLCCENSKIKNNLKIHLDGEKFIVTRMTDERDIKNEKDKELQKEKIKVENDSESQEFEVAEITKVYIKGESGRFTDTDTADTVSESIFNEHNFTNPVIKCEGVEEMMLENNLDTETCGITEITEEFIIKSEDDADSVASVSSETHECRQTTTKDMLEYPGSENSCKRFVCIQCNGTFTRKVCLHNHILVKHPDFIASVTSKIHECTDCSYKSTLKRELDNHIIKKHSENLALVTTKIHECEYCTFKTTSKGLFARHMMKHPEAEGGCERKTCIYCNATFKDKINLHDHIIKEHPEHIASVSSKIHECTHCTYKTTIKVKFTRHVLKHSVADSSYKQIECIHCEEAFTRKATLDGHIIKKHPEYIASVSSKIHKCPYCTYITTAKQKLDRHMSQHTESRKLSTCIHCKAAFTHKRSLEDHIIKKHPEFSAEVSGEIHECIYCTYKSTIKYRFHEHIMLMHPEAADGCKFSVCIHCNARFRNKQRLDGHIIKKHPDFITEVSSKIYACMRCAYRTTSEYNFDRHTLKHPGKKIKVENNLNSKESKATQITHGLIKDEDGRFVDGDSIAHSCSTANRSDRTEPLIKCEATDEVKVENDSDTDTCGITRITEECIIKNDNDDDAGSIASVSRQTNERTRPSAKDQLTKQLLKNPVVDESCKNFMCIHCDMTFKIKICLDNHIVKKHPEHIASVSRKIHECTHCAYKSTFKSQISKHMSKHPDADSRYKFSVCIHCNSTFRSKLVLNNHIFKKHPECIALVSRKILECTHCTYKTVIKRELDNHIIKNHPENISLVSSKIHECKHCMFKTTSTACLARHMGKHPRADSGSKLKTRVHSNRITCIHCKATFNYKRTLDDHIIKKHPEFATEFSSKIHECAHCRYKTTLIGNFSQHMQKHAGAGGGYEFKTCIHCNATFKIKRDLDDHTIMEHPGFIAEVSSKVHECIYCTYKTTRKSRFDQHMLKHPEAADSCGFNICIHCNTTFRNKQMLDRHIIKKHPDFIGEVSGKV